MMPIATTGWLLSQIVSQADRFNGTRSWSLVLGVAMFVAGVFLLISHKRFLNQFLTECDDDRERRFELRKFRRRSLAGSMIASVGCMIAALYWVTDARIFSIFILLILGLLIAILVIACFDLFSVSLQAATHTESRNQREKIDAFLQQRKDEMNGDAATSDAEQQDSTSGR